MSSQNTNPEAFQVDITQSEDVVGWHAQDGVVEKVGEEDEGIHKSFWGDFGPGPLFLKPFRSGFDAGYIVFLFSSVCPSPLLTLWCPRIVFEREEAFLKWWVTDCLNPSKIFWTGDFEAAQP